MFENEVLMKVIERHLSTSTLENFDINEKELCVFREGFEKRRGQLGESYFTQYARNHVSVLKKQFSLVYQSKICTNPGYRNGGPNAVQSGLGQQACGVVHDIIEMNESSDF